MMNPGNPAAAGMAPLQNQRGYNVTKVVADGNDRIRGGKSTNNPPRTKSGYNVRPEALSTDDFTHTEQGSGYERRWQLAPHATEHALTARRGKQMLVNVGMCLKPAPRDFVKSYRTAGNAPRFQPATVENPESRSFFHVHHHSMFTVHAHTLETVWGSRKARYPAN